jgi:polyribonucleotide nucleotidyltransferase
MNNEYEASLTIEGLNISLSSGKLAKQANGSIVLTTGNVKILATATMSKVAKEGIDFLPLTVEYTEKMYSAGKIPGGFFKREARPSTQETLIARLIDRPLRPCFPKGFHNEIQVVITVLSYDNKTNLEPLSIIAASAALSISDIPFNGPIGSVVVGQENNAFTFNPTNPQLKESDLHLVLAGNKEAVLMVEAGAKELSEETIIDAILKGHDVIKQTIALQEDLVSKKGKQKAEVAQESPEVETYKNQINTFLGSKIEDFLSSSAAKSEVETFLRNLETSVMDEFVNEEAGNASIISKVYNSLKKDKIREVIIKKKIRVDGRKTDEIRPLAIETGLLPATHGSSLFTRGETQSLGVVTLGTSDDEMLIDNLEPKSKSKYYFHYNFPPYSVGEVGFMRTGRRELGHGALAERALSYVLPDLNKDFPYTVRIVSEILESNGSSSMASVCSGSLALMDCGVPIKESVSGIAMGLLMDGDDYIILSDIQGLEDHYGDMDFKVAGTKNGVTALQLDIKIAGLSQQILKEALSQAKQGRHFILDEMNQVIEKPRETLSENAPKIDTFFINPEKVGVVIGPGGKMIRKIEEISGATVSVADGTKGEITVAAVNQESLTKAKDFIIGLVRDPEVGDEFKGKVIKTATFGAFIELTPGKEGLLHISKISRDRVEKVEDYLSVGDNIDVKIEKIDNQNRISLVRN